MKSNKLVAGCIALILLLVLSQKIGIGIYMHNSVHEKNCEQPFQKSSSTTLTSISCQCIDDFFMPMTETAVYELSFPQKSFSAHYSFYKQPSLSSLFLYTSSRGPPAVI